MLWHLLKTKEKCNELFIVCFCGRAGPILTMCYHDTSINIKCMLNSRHMYQIVYHVDDLWYKHVYVPRFFGEGMLMFA